MFVSFVCPDGFILMGIKIIYFEILCNFTCPSCVLHTLGGNELLFAFDISVVFTNHP